MSQSRRASRPPRKVTGGPPGDIPGEVRRRIREIDAGLVELLDGDQVLAELLGPDPGVARR